MESVVNIAEFFRKLEFICHWTYPVKDFDLPNLASVVEFARSSRLFHGLFLVLHRRPPVGRLRSSPPPPPESFSDEIFRQTPKWILVSRSIRSTIHRRHTPPLFSTMAAAATLTISTAATLPPPPLCHHHHQHANATATLTSSSSSTPPAATCHHTIATIPRMYMLASLDGTERGYRRTWTW
nr:hypothetical protein [Tanacetum cinerariifolium]